MTGSFTPDDAKTYRMVPFRVPEGTTRVEVGYEWADVPPAPEDDDDGSTVDLGLWDADGYTEVDGFRGWSGSRQGKIAEGMDPVWVQAGSAERGFNPGPIKSGTWWVELGAGGVAPNGTTYRVEIRCRSAKTAPEAPADEAAPKPDPVDPAHVADPDPGWYYGDFHLHGYHSHPEGLTGPEVVEAAMRNGLNIVPVTEYVTNRHWNDLGEAQREHPETLLWPGREVITYFGHSIVLGETPDVIEYRHGFEGVDLGDIQKAVKAEGALYGVAHPTIFPPESFGNMCRGCFFQLGEDIDWSLVDTMELHTGEVPQSPFTRTAIDFWDQKLHDGHKITGISGSDDKHGSGYGATATAVYAEELSRSAVADALLRGHAYVMVLGVEDSPHLELHVKATNGQEGIFGDTLVADEATATMTVTGGEGQAVDIIRNGEVVETREVDVDPWTTTIEMTRDPETEGLLGTYWRTETRDGDQLTTVANPVFLADEEPPLHTASTIPAFSETDPAAVEDEPRGDDGSAPVVLLVVAAALVGGGATVFIRRRRATTAGDPDA